MRRTAACLLTTGLLGCAHGPMTIVTSDLKPNEVVGMVVMSTVVRIIPTTVGDLMRFAVMIEEKKVGDLTCPLSSALSVQAYEIHGKTNHAIPYARATWPRVSPDQELTLPLSSGAMQVLPGAHVLIAGACYTSAQKLAAGERRL